MSYQQNIFNQTKINGMKKLLPVAAGLLLLSAVKTQAQNSSYRIYQKLVKTKLSAFKPLSSSSLQVVSGPVEAITVTSTPQFTVSSASDPKRTFNSTLVNGNCNALPVSYKVSLDRVGVIFPPTNYVAKIYPGAVYAFNEIKNMSFSPYTGHTARNPMDLSTTIFTSSNAAVSSEIRNFDFSTLNQTWVSLLRQNITGATPGNISSELILAESKSQVKVDLNTMSQVDVGVKLGFPLPDIPVTVSVGENVSVTNTSNISSSAENQKNTVILKFNQVFYSSIITPKQSNLNIFSDVANSTLPSDLMYISSVDYGQVYYIVFTSTYSKETLMRAISQKVGTRTDLGVSVEGFPVTADLSVGTNNLTESQVNSILSSASTSVKVLQFGGQPVGVNMGTTVEQVLNNMGLIKTQFSATNLGAPIAYTLNFCKDHALAYVNYNLNYATANCGYTFRGKYDVELELDHIAVSNCRDMDGTEDLYGEVKFTYLKALDKTVGTDKVFWSMSENNANNNPFRNGTRPVDEKKLLITGLTLNELKNLVLYIGGDVKDDEGILPSREFKCSNCQEFSGNFGKRKIFFADEAPTLASIDKLVPNGTYQSLSFGSDKLLTLSFYESGNANDGIVKFNWKVNVKPN